MESPEYHIPVLLGPSVDGLNICQHGVYVDVTLGGGGHSREILHRLSAKGRLFSFDQDADAIARSQREAEATQRANADAPMTEANSTKGPTWTLVQSNFRYLKNFLRLHGVRCVDGVLADLGVSSHQFDVADRGFSTRFDGALDLRMDRRGETTGADLVNSLGEEDLARLLKLYGELPNAKQMARAIVQYRTNVGIQTTGELREAVSRHLPKGMENKYLAMLFQALRIEVNGELDALKEMLQQACEVLVPGGRLVVISYHSLEDRLVKNFMRSGHFEGEVEKDFYGNVLSPMRMVSHGAVQASDEEVQRNNRARSARLRVGEKRK